MSTLIQKAEMYGKQDFSELPIIDLTNATSSDFEERKALAMDIQRASLGAGFFYIKNHGVKEAIVSQTFSQSKLFFDLPESTKSEIDISNSDNFRGHMKLLTESYDPESEGDLHEAFNIGLDPLVAEELGLDTHVQSTGEGRDKEVDHGENLWLEQSSWEGATAFKNTLLAYYREIVALGQRLFPLFALALELPEDFFADKTLHPAAIMRLLYYPPLNRPPQKNEHGIGEHTDFECFTVLRQEDVEGLEVKNLKGEWIKAPCLPETFVINGFWQHLSIGDQFARWTNGVFTSTSHRALPPSQSAPRYSIPVFWGVDHHIPMHPIPTCVSEERPNRYELMTAGAYVQMRLEEAYVVGEKK